MLCSSVLSRGSQPFSLTIQKFHGQNALLLPSTIPSTYKRYPAFERAVSASREGSAQRAQSQGGGHLSAPSCYDIQYASYANHANAWSVASLLDARPLCCHDIQSTLPKFINYNPDPLQPLRFLNSFNSAIEPLWSLRVGRPYIRSATNHFARSQNVDHFLNSRNCISKINWFTSPHVCSRKSLRRPLSGLSPNCNSAAASCLVGSILATSTIQLMKSTQTSTL